MTDGDNGPMIVEVRTGMWVTVAT